MKYEKINFLSLFGKKMAKYDNKIKIKRILKKKNELIPHQEIIDSYIDKNWNEKKSDYEINKEKEKFNSFLDELNDYSNKIKEKRDEYFSKIKGYKNFEEEKQIKEKRKKRFQDIISLKKRRISLQSHKLFPNFRDFYSPEIPNLNVSINKKNFDKYKVTFLTEKTNNSKIYNNKNKAFFPIPTLPNINNIHNGLNDLNKKIYSSETSKTNRIINISTEKSLTNRTKNKILSPKSQIQLFNIKLKKKKKNFLINTKNKYIQIKQKISPINNFSNNSNILSNFDKSEIPIKEDINKNKSNSKINLFNKKMIRRSISSFILNNDENISLNDYSNIMKKVPNKLIKYQKRWNSPKAILFDKIVGRYDENQKKKLREIKGIKSYFPNYNSILVNHNKSFVKYGKNKEIALKNLKIDTTRKLISNYYNLIHSSSNSYIVMDIIKKENQKRKEEKINKMKEKYGLFYELVDNIKK